MPAYIAYQIWWLFVLPIPVACLTWTFTHEELFREPMDYLKRHRDRSKTILGRKFFYLFTCEYCFSHYVAFAFLLLTHFRLLEPDWRGLIIAGFSMVWVANIYMSLFGMLRMDLKKERIVVKKIEEEVKS
jgi:hypothetical protein